MLALVPGLPCCCARCNYVGVFRPYLPYRACVIKKHGLFHETRGRPGTEATYIHVVLSIQLVSNIIHVSVLYNLLTIIPHSLCKSGTCAGFQVPYVKAKHAKLDGVVLYGDVHLSTNIQSVNRTCEN